MSHNDWCKTSVWSEGSGKNVFQLRPTDISLSLRDGFGLKLLEKYQIFWKHWLSKRRKPQRRLKIKPNKLSNSLRLLKQ